MQECGDEVKLMQTQHKGKTCMYTFFKLPG